MSFTTQKKMSHALGGTIKYFKRNYMIKLT